ncbi:hypothetical protein ACVWZR_007111 [Bradyrhizobium sp. i1.3.1]
MPTTKGVERTSAPPGVAVPPSCVPLVIAGVDSTLPPRVTLLTPSNPAAVPPIVTSAVVLVVIWMLPLAFIVTLEAGTPAPDAIALRTSDISALVGDFRPIVVTAGGPATVETPETVLSKLIVWPLTVNDLPARLVRRLVLRCVAKPASRDVLPVATAEALSSSATEPVAVVAV